MLHNSGSYGPNDAPINMGAPVNMTSMTSPMNMGHNLSNLGKIAEQPPQPPPSHYNISDYPTYGHHPLSMPSQMHPFQSFNPIGYQPSYLMQNSAPIPDTSWQNGMLPMNLNAQSNHALPSYPTPCDKRPVDSIANDDFKEQIIIHKNMPITIPQVPPKPFHKQHTDHGNYGLYNINEDRFNRYNRNIDLTSKDEKPLLDNTRRKSLENTVRLIENILINTTRNKELQRQQDRIAENELNLAHKQVNAAYNLSPRRANADVQPHSPIKVEDCVDKKEEKTEEIKEENEEFAKEMINEKDKLTNEQSSESEDNDIKSTNMTTIENVVIKIEAESEPEIVVKVEPVWDDIECGNPFYRDINAVPREHVGNIRIVDPESSVNEATAIVKSGSGWNSYFECSECNLIFKNPKRFLIHSKWHRFGQINDKRIEQAKLREMERNIRKEARIVDRINAKEVQDSDSSKKVYPCKECDKAFTSKGSLKNHKQRYHPTRVRECKICRKSVLGWLALRKHLQTHTDDAGFQCADCDKSFKYAHSLAKHRDTHLEKTLTCEQCPKKFGSNAQLKMHQKVHERAQRGTTFRCSYCAKGFYESYNLTVHERTHRNERPFLCDICNTSFGTNSSLKRHLRVSHSRSKPYECSTCHRSFVTESIRDRHELRQHGDPDDFKFTCEQCDCRYLKQKDLQKHIYKAHPTGKRKKKDKSDSE